MLIKYFDLNFTIFLIVESKGNISSVMTSVYMIVFIELRSSVVSSVPYGPNGWNVFIIFAIFGTPKHKTSFFFSKAALTISITFC